MLVHHFQGLIGLIKSSLMVLWVLNTYVV
uniref:Uncharacterized protein n=1 Tax=Arundo donax TaxID=35708 RepID=A0A0A9GNM7_ARUDO